MIILRKRGKEQRAWRCNYQKHVTKIDRMILLFEDKTQLPLLCYEFGQGCSHSPLIMLIWKIFVSKPPHCTEAASISSGPKLRNEVRDNRWCALIYKIDVFKCIWWLQSKIPYRILSSSWSLKSVSQLTSLTFRAFRTSVSRSMMKLPSMTGTKTKVPKKPLALMLKFAFRRLANIQVYPEQIKSSSSR